jgi:ATP-dependent Lhr-like helicase
LFCYPFAGRIAHVGLGSLLAWRVARDAPGTFSIAMNDYGFELLSTTAFDWAALFDGPLLADENLADDLLASLNSSELAQRRFREIARIAGLVFEGHPGQRKSARLLQASSSLFYEVLRRHDSTNLLLAQASQEVMLQELEIDRIRAALTRMRASRLAFHPIAKPTPFAFPLIIGRLRERISTEKLSDRVQRMLAALEAAADRNPAAPRRRSKRDSRLDNPNDSGDASHSIGGNRS